MKNGTITIGDLRAFAYTYSACWDARVWLAELERDSGFNAPAYLAWRTCPHGDWLLWLLDAIAEARCAGGLRRTRIDRSRSVRLAAIECARTVIDRVEDPEARSKCARMLYECERPRPCEVAIGQLAEVLRRYVYDSERYVRFDGLPFLHLGDATMGIVPFFEVPSAAKQVTAKGYGMAVRLAHRHARIVRRHVSWSRARRDLEPLIRDMVAEAAA